MNRFELDDDGVREVFTVWIMATVEKEQPRWEVVKGYPRQGTMETHYMYDCEYELIRVLSIRSLGNL